ncbi:MAG: DUF5706 domain-containing protein [Flavobacteriaceae bacterium]|nr:DUF5706 domain-containing protein [Flavobacteriaceae bacterium]
MKTSIFFLFIFFCSFICFSQTSDAYSKTFFEISKDEDRLFHQLGHQIFIVSKIADVKFKYVQKSLRFLAAGLVVLLIVLLYYILISNI